MIVVDTDVIAYYFVSGVHSELAVSAYTRDPIWVAPYLWRSEFRNTMLLYLRQQLLQLPQVMQIIRAAETLMNEREFDVRAEVVMALAAGSNSSAYDCEFVALAQQLGVPLVSADRQLVRAFPDVVVSLRRFAAG